MSEIETTKMTDEEAKNMAEEGCATFIAGLAWFFCIPFILMKIWNAVIVQKFDLDDTFIFTYSQMFAIWFGYQLFTQKFTLQLPFVGKIKAMKITKED